MKYVCEEKYTTHTRTHARTRQHGARVLAVRVEFLPHGVRGQKGLDLRIYMLCVCVCGGGGGGEDG